MNLKKIQDAESVKELNTLVWTDPERCSGILCFNGTRVFVSILYDFIDSGNSLEEFQTAYDWISKKDAQRVLELRSLIETEYENFIR